MLLINLTMQENKNMEYIILIIIILVLIKPKKYKRTKKYHKTNHRPKRNNIISFPERENKFTPQWEKIILEDGSEYYILANQDEADKRVQTMPYVKKNLLTKTEYEFWNILRNECSKYNIIICPKVRMEDFIDVTAEDFSTKQSYRGKIKSRHIDFILCDNKLNILAGLELDDNSHLSTDAKITDEFKNNVFRRINIPLYRVPVNRKDYTQQINNILIKLGYKTTNEEKRS